MSKMAREACQIKRTDGVHYLNIEGEAIFEEVSLGTNTDINIMPCLLMTMFFKALFVLRGLNWYGMQRCSEALII